MNGLGKTSITLCALKHLIEQGTASKVLIVAPLRVCHGVWPKERDKWCDFNGLGVNVLHGPKKEVTDAPIQVINYEGLEWLLGAKDRVVNMKLWKSYGFDTLVADELSRLKHPNTKRFKILKQVLGTFQRRWGLTGSPASNGLLDLFGQIYCLDMGRSLGPYITHYRMKYFLPDYMGYNWTLREGADREIYARIAPLTLRMSAADHLDLPELVNNTLYVDMPVEAMRAYRLMEAVLVAQIRDKTITAANAAAASTKCRQLANGGVYYDEEVGGLRGVQEVHTAKVEALQDLVEELQGTPLLVAYEFDHDLQRILKVLGKDTPYIAGGVSTKKADSLIARWNGGDLPVLLAHPATLAHGVNLQGAGNHVCFFSIPWDFEKYDQFTRRVWRQGQKEERVIVHHIVARGTIDEVILKVLRGKERTQTALFDALKELGKEATPESCEVTI